MEANWKVRCSVVGASSCQLLTVDDLRLQHKFSHLWSDQVQAIQRFENKSGKGGFPCKFFNDFQCIFLSSFRVLETV